MNQDLTERIKNYLQLETNYAIIINGEYGIGKTHYLTKELFPEVKKIDIPNSPKNQKFTPILISLFGINSIEELGKQIVFELYPILKSKGFKLVGGIVNLVSKHFTGDQFPDLLKGSGDSFDFSKVLICIDDFDRKGRVLKLDEVFGFVNNLVENSL